MTAGLQAAHTAGVIHRDFKPGNLVLVPEAGAAPDDPQRLVISDFGLARRHGLGEETITSTGESLGTPLYMAPEQVHSGVEPITPGDGPLRAGHRDVRAGHRRDALQGQLDDGDGVEAIEGDARCRRARSSRISIRAGKP